MNHWPIADAHTDYLMNLRLKRSTVTDRLDAQRHISFESLQAGGVKLQVFAAFTGDPAQGHPTVQALEMFAHFERMLCTWGSENILPVVDKQSSVKALESDAMGAILSIEGGEAFAGSIDVLSIMARFGVRMATLVWNHENEIGYPAVQRETVNERLKPFGRQCVDYMCKHHIAIDVSHLNDAGFWEVYERASVAPLASHSNARALCASPRNLTDDQIRAIIDAKGFIGLNFFTGFLRQDGECTIEDIVRHARHILDLGGEKVLGFGSDFDGIDTAPRGVLGAQSFQAIVSALKRAGIDGALLEGITHRNFIRYISEVFSA
jgi:membrane dipeptidase